MSEKSDGLEDLHGSIRITLTVTIITEKSGWSIKLSRLIQRPISLVKFYLTPISLLLISTRKHSQIYYSKNIPTLTIALNSYGYQ